VLQQSDTSNNRGNWNHFKINQTLSGQRTWKARHQGGTENSQRARNLKRADVHNVS
jgi:hypothetical protein